MTTILTLLLSLVAGAISNVTSLAIVPSLDRTEILVSVERPVEVRDFTMEGPNRLVLDVINAQHLLPQENYVGINRGGVRSVRSSQYSDDIVRIVVELNQLVEYTVEQYDGYVHISLANPFGNFEPWDAAVDGAVAVPTASFVNEQAEAASTAAVPQEAPTRRITIAFNNSPISEVLFAFAEFADRSIVPGAQVTGSVTAEIRNQAWDDALKTILQMQGLIGVEDENGIISVENMENLNAQEAFSPLRSRPYRINYGTSTEMAASMTPLLSSRGLASDVPGMNTVIVTDIDRVHEAVDRLIRELDVPTAQVMISAKIIFVNRTDLDEFGVAYDLKDSEGNQLNVLSPGAADLDGDGILDEVPQGTNVVSLGGSSIAALGNAQNRLTNPTIQILSSLVLGRHTLVSFVEALESVNLSDIQAAPSVTVADNHEARLQVGERTPIRVLDAGSQGGGGGASAQPVATVQFEETGIILTATPHITASDHILLDVHAERSSADAADADIGLLFRTQETDTRILLRDGETAVISALTVTERSEIRSGIPFLMNIPVLGSIFRTTRNSEIQRDLLVLVTPHIVRTQVGN